MREREREIYEGKKNWSSRTEKGQREEETMHYFTEYFVKSKITKRKMFDVHELSLLTAKLTAHNSLIQQICVV